MQLMSIRLYSLLCLMYATFRNWGPRIGFPSSSAGFYSGGSVADFSDLEEACDAHAVQALEVGWDALTAAERIMVEQTIGVLPWVFTARPGVLESAVAKLEKRLRVIA